MQKTYLMPMTWYSEEWRVLLPIPAYFRPVVIELVFLFRLHKVNLLALFIAIRAKPYVIDEESHSVSLD